MATEMSIDEALLEWATPRQGEALTALVKYGSVLAASEYLGITPGRLRGLMSELRRRAARSGYSPGHDMTHTAPEGFHIKGVSTYYRRDPKTGESVPSGQWVKTKVDEQHKMEMLLDAVQRIAEPLSGKSVKINAPRKTDKDTLTVYPMGDPHLGMYAWAQETGEDFDLEIAERNLIRAVDHLADLAPPSECGLVINLGDFFHTDTPLNRTARSGNPLDVDTRWSKVLSVGVRTMRRIIDRALEKHKRVRVINAIGNHDDNSAIMLSICLDQYYSNNKRVEIDTNPTAFHWYRFGKNLLGVTHGDKVKPRDLPGVMANDRKRDWGETEYRYFYTGHVHHDQLKEYPGCIVETFRTLAGTDAWHHSHGYRSGRDMKCDVLHKEYGRINRHVVGIRQIWGGV